MATTPELEQALQEIASALGKEKKPSKKDLQKLPFIDAEDYLINGECLDFKKS